MFVVSPSSAASSARRGESSGASRARSSGNRPKPSRSVDRSRGRALRRAMRERMRSRSPTARNRSRRASLLRDSINVATAWWRSRNVARSRNGRCSQRRNRRPPIGEMVESSTPSRVVRVSPSMRLSFEVAGVAAFIAMAPSRTPPRWRSGAAAAASGFLTLANSAARRIDTLVSRPKPTIVQVKKRSSWRAAVGVEQPGPHAGARRCSRPRTPASPFRAHASRPASSAPVGLECVLVATSLTGSCHRLVAQATPIRSCRARWQARRFAAVRYAALRR